MALIQCPECGGQMSTDAVACPHCGYQTGATVKQDESDPLSCGISSCGIMMTVFITVPLCIIFLLAGM